jgi:hypothetical protein
MMNDIIKIVKPGHACQVAKRGGKGYGKIPLKDVEHAPWEDISVDLSGPWEATNNNKKESFHTLTIIDVFTGWVEIIPIKKKTAAVARRLIEQEWLRRYSRPNRILFDHGGEFDSQEFYTLCLIWHVIPVPITVKNPRANVIVERMHQVLANMLRVQLTTQYEGDDPIKDMRSAAAYAIRATVHGTTKHSPSQLVDQKDMILRTTIKADLAMIRQQREAAVKANNVRENKRRIAYPYRKRGQVLILSRHMDPKLNLHKGPYKVISYNKENGTLHIQRNNYIEPINMRNVRPYFGD